MYNENNVLGIKLSIVKRLQIEISVEANDLVFLYRSRTSKFVKECIRESEKKYDVLRSLETSLINSF